MLGFQIVNVIETSMLDHTFSGTYTSFQPTSLISAAVIGNDKLNLMIRKGEHMHPVVYNTIAICMTATAMRNFAQCYYMGSATRATWEQTKSHPPPTHA